MKLTEQFLEELDREAAITRRVLAEVPEGHLDYKPHEKSMPFGYLCTLTAIIVSWIEMIINMPELDIAPAEPRQKPPDAKNADDLIKALDGAVAKARAALQATNDEHLHTDWRMLARGNVVQVSPRWLFIQESVFHHLAHHRGQLSVYLRLLDAKVPSIYGPSADEKFS